MEEGFAMSVPTHKPIVLIGYGNELRGDDALGRLVVEKLAAEQLLNVEVFSEPQLFPELAENIANSRAVIFVDACLVHRMTSIVMREITDASHFHGATHESGPRELLGLAAMCYGCVPRAWLMAVPAWHLKFADGPSPDALRIIDSAVRYIAAFVRDLQNEETSYA
jgi:hydrogenase maturation protease